MKTSKSAANRLITARFDYQATESHELTVSRGERLILLDSTREWWLVQNTSNQSGYVPSNYVKRERQNLLTSIRSAFRDVLRRRENKDGMSRSFGGDSRYSAPRRTNKQQLTPTRSDPNLNVISQPHHTLAPFTPLGLAPPHKGASLNRMDPRYASFSCSRAQPLLYGAPQQLAPRGSHYQVVKAFECESYTASAFEMVPSQNGPIRFATVLYTYVAQRFDELTLRRGDRVGVYEVCVDGWWRVQYVGTQAGTGTGSESTRKAQAALKLPLLTRIGWFPSNYLELDAEECDAVPQANSATVMGTNNAETPNSATQNNTQEGCISSDVTGTDECSHNDSRFSAGNPLSSSRVDACTPDDSVARTEPEPGPGPETDVETDAQRRSESSGRSAEKVHSKVNTTASVSLAAELESTSACTSASGDTSNGARPTSSREPVTAERPDRDNDKDRCSVHSRANVSCTVDADVDTSAEWYWAAARRVDCERALAAATGGSFVVRDCESSPGDFTIVVRRDEDAVRRERERERLATVSYCRNFRVHFVAVGPGGGVSPGPLKRTGLFAIGTLKFFSFDALLSHYRRHPIFSSASETLFLVAPLRRNLTTQDRSSVTVSTDSRPTKTLSGSCTDVEMRLRPTPQVPEPERTVSIAPSAVPMSTPRSASASPLPQLRGLNSETTAEQIYDSAFANSALRFRDSIPRFNTDSHDDGTDV